MNHMLPRVCICLVLMAAQFSATPAGALQISQEEFSDSFKDGDLEMVLMGATLKRFQISKAVAVGLYMEEGVEEEQILTAVPKRVEMAILQNLSREELIKEAVKGMRDNLSPEAFTQIEPDIDRFSGWMRNVEPGDRYAFTYLPDRGTQVDLNGVKQGVIESVDFALGYFSIYIGAKPTDPRAKRKLLGRLEFYQ
ncbi:MAG: chalcone isomerase family protein [Candidatus Omnitrophica bacterium]|nr:chalcone isomerase family protein [Candidatus Omnitrophota bacterium]